MLSENQLKEIASIFNISEIKEFIEKNNLDYILFKIDEEDKNANKKVRIGFFGTLSIIGGVKK